MGTLLPKSHLQARNAPLPPQKKTKIAFDVLNTKELMQKL
jgi:hypothetical protein